MCTAAAAASVPLVSAAGLCFMTDITRVHNTPLPCSRLLLRHSHRPSAHTLLLDEFDIDMLAHDLVMHREDLKQRLQVFCGLT